MPSYTIRIQLTGSPDQDTYDDLHTRMEAGGFERTVMGGKTVNLPHEPIMVLRPRMLSRYVIGQNSRRAQHGARARFSSRRRKPGRGVNLRLVEERFMADATGHMDRPGAGPWSVNQAVDGILTGYYTHPNHETGRVELVKGNPSGTPDAVVKDFPNTTAACLWLQTEWRAGRL